MNFKIKIQTPNCKASWEKELDQDEFQRVQGLLQSRRMIPIFPAALYPVRSDSCKNFCKDFFLPTFINQALKAKTIAGKIFAAFFALVFDVATLPFRLITWIPALICNKKKEVHPLHKFLRGKADVDSRLLQSDRLLIEQSWITTKEKDVINAAGETTQVEERERHTKQGFVNLINIPIHDDFDKYSNMEQVTPVE